MVTVDRSTPVAVFELLLVFLGAGSALVIAPAIDLVMTSVPSERAGVGSAFSSAIRSIGGALGIAVLGSVLSTAYRSRIDGSLEALPVGVREVAGESIGGTQLIVSGIHDQLADHGRGPLEAASSAFAGAMHITAGLSAAAAAVALLIVLVWMPRHSTSSIGGNEVQGVEADPHGHRRWPTRIDLEVRPTGGAEASLKPNDLAQGDMAPHSLTVVPLRSDINYR
jgi:MFS transporter, DHA2 family, multidrug resistance protein